MEPTSSDEEIESIAGPSAPPPRTPGKSLIRPKLVLKLKWSFKNGFKSLMNVY